MTEDDIEPNQNGRPRRHDGRDPWSVVPRAAVLADAALAADLTVDATPAEPTAGDLVAIVLRRDREDLQGRFEALWAEVTAVDGDALVALLDNQPTYIRGLSPGDEIRCTRDDVLAVRTPRRRR